MLLFPYQLDLYQKGKIVLTPIICLICIVAFIHQSKSFDDYFRATVDYCRNELDVKTLDIIRTDLQAENCADFLVLLAHSENPKKLLSEKIENSVADKDEKIQLIANTLEAYRKIVPGHATADWWYEPTSFDFKRMITSSFSHADWQHIALNLVFFYSFSVSAELMLGVVFYAIFFIYSCVVVSIVYSLGAFGVTNTLPVVGLSGVVFSVMTMMAVIYPHKKVRFFYWLIFALGVFRVPLLLVVAAYVGLNYYHIVYKTESNVSYIGHIGGATAGASAAVIYLGVKQIKNFFANENEG